MDDCLSDLRDKSCLPYLDNLLAYSPSFDSHLNDVQAALHRLKAKEINLKPQKCDLFRREEQVTWGTSSVNKATTWILRKRKLSYP